MIFPTLILDRDFMFTIFCKIIQITRVKTACHYASFVGLRWHLTYGLYDGFDSETYLLMRW